MGPEGEQVGSRLFVLSGSAHGFAVQGNGVLGLGTQRRAYPVSEGPFDVLCIQTGQQFARKRVGRAQEATWPEEPDEQGALITTQLSHGKRRVTIAEQGSYQADEQVG